jgi:glycosyltransferase involved in cell wall biosynthesis
LSVLSTAMLIDITRLLGRFLKGRLPTGVDRVSLAYIGHYGHKSQALVRWAGRCFVLSAKASERIYKHLLSSEWHNAEDIRPAMVKGILTGRCKQKIPGRFLFNTGHSGLDQPDYPALLTRLRVRPIFLVHDLIPITHPEYCRAGELQRHAIRMTTALDYAAGIITNSQSTLDILKTYACKVGKTMPQAIPALLAPEVLHITSGLRPIAERYFVMLGTIEPRKNHWLMLQVWRRLIERLGENAPKLVVIGQRGWECENVIDLLERCEQLQGRVIERADCTDAELVTWLHHSQALLFPSFAEGYGLPVVEAMALGVPVIASNLPVFREIAGDIPEYVDPLDGKRWGEVIEEYALSQSPSRSSQVSRLGTFKAPTWEEHFARVDEFLERLRG